MSHSHGQEAGDRASFNKARAVEETDNALRVFFLGKSRWVPKSGIHEDSEVFSNGHFGRLVVKAWLARNEKWELD